MDAALGIVIIGLSLLCWGGQSFSWVRPSTAVRLGLTEDEDDVEPVYWADSRGEALWDTLVLWTMVVAGVLLVLDRPSWAYFGLVGGGMYLYFAGRGILTRVAIARRGFRVGDPKGVRIAFIFLAVWGVLALVTIVAAIAELESW